MQKRRTSLLMHSTRQTNQVVDYFKDIEKIESEESEKSFELQTVQRQEKDVEIFEINAPKFDHENFNLEQSKHEENIANALIPGVNLINDDVGTSQAYNFFTELELKH